MDAKQTEAPIVKTLVDAKWEYRTAEGIAAETGLDRSVVANFIESPNS